MASTITTKNAETRRIWARKAVAVFTTVQNKEGRAPFRCLKGVDILLRTVNASSVPFQDEADNVVMGVLCILLSARSASCPHDLLGLEGAPPTLGDRIIADC